MVFAINTGNQIGKSGRIFRLAEDGAQQEEYRTRYL
jgi:hypothetical protein